MASILIMFLLGAFIYMGIEVAFDNTSDRSMGLVGGLLFVLCQHYDEWIGITVNYPASLFSIKYWIVCLLIAITITVFEYIAGKVFNKNYTIWDYRKFPFNIQGQVCLAFSLIWFFIISHVIIYLGNSFALIF